MRVLIAVVIVAALGALVIFGLNGYNKSASLNDQPATAMTSPATGQGGTTTAPAEPAQVPDNTAQAMNKGASPLPAVPDHPANNSAQTTAGDVPKVAPPAVTADNAMTEQQAQQKITAAGYTQVSSLTKDAGGSWHGTAVKDGATVKVALDSQGKVVAD